MKLPTKQNYIDRLVSIGYPPHRAMRVAYAFYKDYGEAELIEYITSLEKELLNVD